MRECLLTHARGRIVGSGRNALRSILRSCATRQISQLYLMTPGAVNYGAGTFDDMRFNGRSYEENAIRYDGIEAGGIISNNPSDFNGEIPGPFRLQASLENVQEFRVESNNYPAEFGTGTGGQISIITKSGGNAY